MKYEQLRNLKTHWPAESIKRTVVTITIAFGILPVIAHSAARAEGKLLHAATIVQLMRKVNSYQQAHPWKERSRWIPATFYMGVMALYETTKDPAILDQALRWAQENQWAEGQEKEPSNRMTCGQTYLQLYFLKNDPAMIAKMKAFIDRQISSGVPGRKAWWYCDALYVASPTLAMMAKATGEIGRAHV